MAPIGAPLCPPMESEEVDSRWTLMRPTTKLMTRIEDALPDLFSNLDASFLTPPRSRRPSSVSSKSSITSSIHPLIPISFLTPLTSPTSTDFTSLEVELQKISDNSGSTVERLLYDCSHVEEEYVDIHFYAPPQRFLFTTTEIEKPRARSTLKVTYLFIEETITSEFRRKESESSASYVIKEIHREYASARFEESHDSTNLNYMGIEHETEANIGATAAVFYSPQMYSVAANMGIDIRITVEEPKIVIIEQKKKNQKPLQEVVDKENGDQTWKEIIVSCNYDTEYTDKRKMLCQLPHFVLYDLPDQEASQVIRMIFAYVNIPFESRDVEEHIIEDFPLRNIPVLEIDGIKIGNNTSICRHLGWRFELSGQTAMEDSIVDMIAETVQESRSKLKEWLDHIEYKKVDYSKPECSDAYALKHIHGYLAPVIEKLLRKSSSPWLVGYKLTWADLMVAAFFNPIIYHRPQFFDKYPNVYLHNKKIAELPQLEGVLYNVRERQFV